MTINVYVYSCSGNNEKKEIRNLFRFVATPDQRVISLDSYR